MSNDLKKCVDREIKALLSDIRGSYKLHVVSKLLFDGIKNFLERKGKRIRPILFLLTYQGYTKRKNFSRKKLLRSSLAFELLHDFLLVHDDIIDRASMRRGKPALHRLYNARLSVSADDLVGSGLGIVAGDVIFALAIEAFLSVDEIPLRKERALKKFIEATTFTGAGEFMDIINGIKRIDEVREREVYLNYTMKTAKYTFEAPMLAGAILAGAGRSELKRLSELGMVLGQAFQIIDDLMDMFFASKKTGKPVLCDLGESKKTLLVWRAYKDLSGKDQKIFKQLFEKKKKNRNDLNRMKMLVGRSGSPGHCLKKARSLLKEAERLISGLYIKESPKKGLSRIVDGLYSKMEELEKNIASEVGRCVKA